MHSEKVLTRVSGDDCVRHSGFLAFEEVEGSDIFVRRFFMLDKQNGRLEYFIDNRPVCFIGSKKRLSSSVSLKDDRT